jgi:hypothetical protein
MGQEEIDKMRDFRPKPGLVGLMERDGASFINQGLQFLLGSNKFRHFLIETDFHELN